MKEITHLDGRGQASMVDVAHKAPTARQAVARAVVEVPDHVMSVLLHGDVPKGDVWATARIAGIQAAKRTADLIPLCHPIAFASAQLHFDVDADSGQIGVTCTVTCVERTGVEMEALTGVSVAALTIYDMLKGLDKGLRIVNVHLVSKTGGKSGSWHTDQTAGPA